MLWNKFDLNILLALISESYSQFGGEKPTGAFNGHDFKSRETTPSAIGETPGILRGILDGLIGGPVEAYNFFRDLNSAAVTGNGVGLELFIRAEYNGSFQYRSNLMKGYDEAVRNGEGIEFLLHVQGDIITFGGLSLGKAIWNNDPYAAGQVVGGLAWVPLTRGAVRVSVRLVPRFVAECPQRGLSIWTSVVKGYPSAINVNSGLPGRPAGQLPTTMTGEPIPNLVVARGQQLPFANGVADLITIENTPIVQATASEVAGLFGQVELSGSKP